MNRMLAVLSAGLLGAAIGAGALAQGAKDVPARPEQRVVSSYESRAASLSRLWARAVFELKFKDAEGRERSEQGEGHVQFLGQDRLAMTLGKVGQRVLYLGCDRERFWFIDMTDGGRAFVGRNVNVGKACMEETGLPANPVDVLAMLGVSELPSGATGRVGGGSGEARILAVTPTGRLRITANVESGEPSRMELLPGGADEPATWAGTPTIVATMSEYKPVAMRGGGAPVRVPGKVVMEARASDMTLTLWLYDPQQGSDRQLPAQAFDLDFLLDALGPASVRQLDAACEEGAPVADDHVETGESDAEGPGGD